MPRRPTNRRGAQGEGDGDRRVAFGRGERRGTNQGPVDRRERRGGAGRGRSEQAPIDRRERRAGGPVRHRERRGGAGRGRFDQAPVDRGRRERRGGTRRGRSDQPSGSGRGHGRRAGADRMTGEGNAFDEAYRHMRGRAPRGRGKRAGRHARTHTDDEINSDDSSAPLEQPSIKKLRAMSSCTVEECDVTTSNMVIFEDHYKVKHSNLLRHKCRVCANLFKEKSELQNHVKEGHIGNIPVCKAEDVFGKKLRKMPLSRKERSLIEAYDHSLLTSSSESSSS